MRITTIILTFNSAPSLGRVLDSCQGISDRLIVVDSYSRDDTEAIAHRYSCEWWQHPFEHYAAQRNWAQAEAQLGPDEWVLHLDSDEVLSPELARAIARLRAQGPAPGVAGYLMQRRLHFLGQPLCWGHMNPCYHLRLFRASDGGCEQRLYDQHYLVNGPVAKLEGLLLDLQLVSLEQWTASHNRWSSAEVQELLAEQSSSQLGESLVGDDPRQRRRWLKNRLYYRLPLFWRATGFFLYSYIFRLGFLDGLPGLIYIVLEVFWFRFLVDAKLLEARRTRTATPAGIRVGV